MADFEQNTIDVNRREALAARLWRAAELQAAEVEARIASGPRPAADAERDAKTLSVLARTLRELSAVDAGVRTEPGGGDDEEIPPDDLETLREELGRKLRAISAARAAEPGDGFWRGAE